MLRSAPLADAARADSLVKANGLDVAAGDAAPKSRTFKAGMLASGQVTASAAGFVILAVLSRLLSRHEYATYRQVLLCFAMVLPFLQLGLPVALYYYLPAEKQRRRGVIVDNLLALALAGSAYLVFLVAGGAGFWAARMGNADLGGLLYLMAPYGVALALRSSLPACFMSADRASALAVYNALSRCFECLLIVLAVLFWGGLAPVVVTTAIGSIVAAAVGVAMALGLYGSGSAAPSLAGIKRQLTYGAPLALAMIFAGLMGYLDQLVVSLKCSPEAFATYVNGAVRLPLLPVIVTSVTAVLLPELTILHKNADHRGMLAIWQNALVKSSYLIIPVTIFIMVLAQDVVVLLFSDRYAASVPIFRVFCLILPFKMVSYEAILAASNKNRYFALVSVITVGIYLPLLVVAVGRFGILGAVVATVFVEVCIRFVLYLVFIGKTVGEPARAVVPARRLWRLSWPALVLACPLLLRPLLHLPPAMSLVVCGLYYFSACYLWLTRRAEAPRLAAVETLLAKAHHGLGLPDGICADRSSR